MFDTVIRQGAIVDGTRMPRYVGDVAIKDGRVAKMGKVKVGELVRDQHVIPGLSDGGAHTKFFTGSSFTTDLIAWLVRERGELTLEDAHYHLSYLPSQATGFTDRGFLREGAPADMVVYDYENLRRIPKLDYEIAFDFPADEWRRIQRAEGYRHIFVNGVETFQDGVCTDETPGQLLRLNRWS